MGFNLLGAIGGAVGGFFTGGPVGAVVGGIGGAEAGGTAPAAPSATYNPLLPMIPPSPDTVSAQLSQGLQPTEDLTSTLDSSGLDLSALSDASQAVPINFPGTQSSMSSSLQQMQQTDSDGAALIGAVFDN
jgi:hypothetical protein